MDLKLSGDPIVYASPDRIATAQTYDFLISPQSLISALDAYNKITGKQIFYDSRLAAGVTSSGACGRMGDAEALNRLLAGTKLTAVRSDTDTISLVLDYAAAAQEEPPAAVQGPTLQLDTMHVNAAGRINHQYYAATVAMAIRNALHQDRRMRKGRYYIVLNVWLNPVGSVKTFEFVSPYVDHALSNAIDRNLKDLPIGIAPPVDLEQPVHIRIRAQDVY